MTGGLQAVNEALPALIGRLRRLVGLPLAVGFGVSTREQFETVGRLADGVVIGSQIIRTLDQAGLINFLHRLAYTHFD